MEFRNLTPFPSIAFDAFDQRDIRFHTVMMRLTFTLQADGTLVLSARQAPLLVTDRYHGEPNTSSVREESDFAPYKPCTDVIVNAHACAPHGKPAFAFLTGIDIRRATAIAELPARPQGLNQFDAPSREQLALWDQRCRAAQLVAERQAVLLSKQLLISGPRAWRRRPWLLRLLTGFVLRRWRLTGAAPVTSLPLCYEYAYGGENKVPAGSRYGRRVPKSKRLMADASGAALAGGERPIAHSVHLANPIGLGWMQTWYLKACRCKRIGAPQITLPTDKPRRHDPRHGVSTAGLGVVARAWQPRLAAAGTYDQVWLDERHPHLPIDFNFRYWNGAPEDQQLSPYLSGNEIITLYNLCPSNTPGATKDTNGNTCMTLRLPGHLPFVVVRYADGRLGELVANLDTLVIESMPDASALDHAITLTGVWRATVAATPRVRVLEARLVASRDIAALRDGPGAVPTTPAADAVVTST